MDGASQENTPVVLAVDDDAGALSRLDSELTGRYGSHYRVLCERSPRSALAALRAMRADGTEVAVVLAAVWMAEMGGASLLAEAGNLHPHAKRGLMIEWGAWGDPPTAEAITRAMAYAIWTTT